MPWSNAWSGGGAVVASSVQVINGQSVVASITPQGNISGQTISANTDIFLAGTSLTTILNNEPRGITAQTQVPSASLPTTAVGATETALMELDTVLTAKRMYQVSLSNILAQCSGSPARVTIRVRYTTDGTTPTIASARLFETYGDDPTSSTFVFVAPNGQSRIFSVASQTTIRMLVTSIDQIITGGVQQTHQFIGLDTGGLPKAGPMLAVNDLGPAIPDTGIFLSSGSTAVFRTFQTPSIDSQSFQQSGPASQGSGANNESFCYFGQDPSFGANGIWRSYAWFSISDTSGGNGLGSISNMAGVSAANISYLDVFVYANWWYQIAGGTMHIGHANTAINHSSENQATTVYNEVSVPYNQRGQGKWISLLGTGIATAINAGAINSIVLADPFSSAVANYGYAAGAADLTNRPQIRAGYFK